MSDQRLLRSVQRLASALGRLERQTAANTGVSVSQLRVLLHLGNDPSEGMRISDLAERQGLAVSTMTRNIALLERKGWVERQTGRDDRRTVWIRLTPSGVDLSSSLKDTTVGKFNQAFATFHPTDRVERAVALDRVAAAIEKVEEGR